MFYVKELWYELLTFALNFQSVGSDNRLDDLSLRNHVRDCRKKNEIFALDLTP